MTSNTEVHRPHPGYNNPISGMRECGHASATWYYSRRTDRIIQREVRRAEVHRLMARRQDYQPSHVLHLLLSVITVGLWIPVWLLVGVSHANERAKIDRKLKKLDDG